MTALCRVAFVKKQVLQNQTQCRLQDSTVRRQQLNITFMSRYRVDTLYRLFSFIVKLERVIIMSEWDNPVEMETIFGFVADINSEMEAPVIAKMKTFD